MRRVFDFLSDHLEYNAESAQHGLYMRNFCKWLLEVIRNLVVVGFLTLLAQKSNGWTLTIVAWTAGFAVWLTVFTYIDPIKPKVVLYKHRWITVALFIFFAVLILALIMSLSFSLEYALNELVKTQATK
jgi:hypothetical protein